jgi:expansin (peptidoglycan-binding protein)
MVRFCRWRRQLLFSSHPWWTAIQMRNHRYPILRFEFQNETGAFTELPRTTYNYFLKSNGLGAGPFIFRVTDIFGHQLTDTVAPSDLDSIEVEGKTQFSICE